MFVWHLFVAVTSRFHIGTFTVASLKDILTLSFFAKKRNFTPPSLFNHLENSEYPQFCTFKLIFSQFGGCYSQNFCGLYYKHVTINNDNSSIVNKWSLKLIDDTRVIIYDRNGFIKKATDDENYNKDDLIKQTRPRQALGLQLSFWKSLNYIVDPEGCNLLMISNEELF